MRRAARGFTLIELVIALTLLAAMMTMLYSGVSFAMRAWDAGELHARRTVDLRISENFLRRELSEIFPMRWKDPLTLRFAFKGESNRLRFVSSRPAGLSEGGLALVGMELESQPGTRSKRLVMRRALPDESAKDFGPLDQAKGTVLSPDVEDVRFSYFGAENDVSSAAWVDEWEFPGKLPMLVRIKVKAADGRELPDFVTRVVVSEEAGCLESTFQRGCRPRRP